MVMWLIHRPCEIPCRCCPAILSVVWIFGKSLPLCIFHINTKALSDYAEIILIRHVTNFVWKKSCKKWVGVWAGGGAWLTERQKAIGRVWGCGYGSTFWGNGN